MSFNAIKYYVIYKSLSRDLCLLSKYASKLTLRQIILLIGYIHTNEQPVVFIP